eukprot:COSAG02_NODE_17998_length_966_cov_4.365629_1_plen_83_part_00
MMTVVVIALAIQIIIIAQIHTVHVLDHESGGTRTPTLAVHNTRVIPLSQAPATRRLAVILYRHRRRPLKLRMTSEVWSWYRI